MRDYPGIYRLAKALNERHQHLDVLVGNAAICGPTRAARSCRRSAWDEAMAVNVTANYHLIRAMDPLLRRATGRPCAVHDFGRRHPRPRLCRPLFGIEGRAQCAGANLCGGNGFDADTRQLCSILARRARACARK